MSRVILHCRLQDSIHPFSSAAPPVLGHDVNLVRQESDPPKAVCQSLFHCTAELSFEIFSRKVQTVTAKTSQHWLSGFTHPSTPPFLHVQAFLLFILWFLTHYNIDIIAFTADFAKLVSKQSCSCLSVPGVHQPGSGPWRFAAFSLKTAAASENDAVRAERVNHNSKAEAWQTSNELKL